ncbi:MAG: hypothetical protein WD382_11795 [Halofilum sp. (in: g-proteobacteria)]
MSEPGTHETRDIPARVPVFVIAFTAVFVPLGALAMWLLMETVWRAAPEPPPVFPEAPPSASAAPPLQASPSADMAAFAGEQDQRLNSIGWVDREAGVVHISIEHAMDLTVERGLPGPASGPPPPPARAPERPQGPSP